MSEQNVEVVRRVYEGLSTRRAIPIDLFHPDFEADARDVAPDIGLVRGAEGFQEAFLSRAETFDAFRVEIQQVINADRGASGDRRARRRARPGQRRRGVEPLLPRLEL